MSSIDFRTMPANVPSLCIPRVFPNIDERRIRGIFADLNIGDIDRIDIVSRKTEKGEKFNRVFVHFKRWSVGGNADIARERLLNGKDIKIVYDEPWFWKISAYKEPTRHSRPVVRPSRAAPRLQFDEPEKSVLLPRTPSQSPKRVREGESDARESDARESDARESDAKYIKN